MAIYDPTTQFNFHQYFWSVLWWSINFVVISIHRLQLSSIGNDEAVAISEAMKNMTNLQKLE